MAKKPTTPSKISAPTVPAPEPAPPAVPAPAPAKAAKPAAKAKPAPPSVIEAPKAVKKPAAKAVKAVAAKAPAKPAKAAKKPAAKNRAKAPSPITQEEVALRAYFIAERRQAEGRWADPSQDWLQAEQEIAAERLAAKK